MGDPEEPRGLNVIVLRLTICAREIVGQGGLVVDLAQVIGTVCSQPVSSDSRYRAWEVA